MKKVIIGVVIGLLLISGSVYAKSSTIKLLDHERGIGGWSSGERYGIFRMCIDGYEYILSVKQQGNHTSQSLIQAYEVVKPYSNTRRNEVVVLPKRCN